MPDYRHRPGKAGRPQASADRPGQVPTAEELRSWALECPLWRWREANQVTRPMAAAMFGVSVTTVHQWEHGAVTPRPERWERLIAALGPEFVEQWAAWLANQPGWSDRGKVVAQGVAAELEAGADELYRRAVDEGGPGA